MSTTFTQPPQSTVQYPDDDGQPMSENTLQFKWIVLIKEGLETLFRHDPNVFVAGDLLWYPEEGKPKIRQAPDVMVVLGRPKEKTWLLQAVGGRRHRPSGRLRGALTREPVQ